MIILDTNVLSALMQQQADPLVVAWLDEQRAESVWLTSVTLFEVRFGLDCLSDGRKKRLLTERFEALLSDDLSHRVLLFDATAAAEAALLAARRKANGQPVDMRDIFIAGITQAKRAALATRNVKHFDDLTVPVINPWAQGAVRP